MTAIAPYTAHCIWPVMKLPGSMLIPWRIHTTPVIINSTPSTLAAIFMCVSRGARRQESEKWSNCLAVAGAAHGIRATA